MNKKDHYKNSLFQEETARGIRELYHLKFLPNEHFGEVSVRDPETGNVFISMEPGTFYIKTPSDYHQSDTVIVNRDGLPLTDFTLPSRGLPLHIAIYKARPEVNAIVRVFTHWSSLFAQRGENIPFVLEEQIKFGGTVHCVSSPPELDEAYCAEVVKALEHKKTAILRNYGAVAVADILDTGINYLSWLESAARKASYASLLGPWKIIHQGEEKYS